jgi:hypothetical protein
MGNVPRSLKAATSGGKLFGQPPFPRGTGGSSGQLNPVDYQDILLRKALNCIIISIW